MQNSTIELKNCINYLDETLHKSYLSGESRKLDSGRLFTVFEEEVIRPKIEQSIRKIRDLIQENPELMKDLTLVDSLLTLGEKCLPVISKLQDSSYAKVYDTLEKLEIFIIKNAIHRGKFKDLNLDQCLQSLGEKLTHKKAKRVLQRITEKILENRKEFQNYPIEFKKIPLAITEKLHPDYHAAATKIQSAFRGWKTRQLVVLPSQILPFLDQHLIDKTNLTDIARGLAREINEMSLNPEKYKGKTIRLKSLEKLYVFPVLEKVRSGKTTFRLNFDCWLEMSADGKSIKLLINDSYLGEGAYKKIFRAQDFGVSFRLQQKQRPMTQHKKIVGFERDPSRRLDVLRGIEIHQQILEKVDKSAKLAVLPRILQTDEGSADSTLELVQDWYNSDFSDVIYHSTIPLDFDSPVVKVSLKEKINMLMDVGLSIEHMHQAGFIHRDIKPKNILINAFFEGFITDFDLSCTVGQSEVIANYEYWDHGTRKGWVTPFCDIYGLGMCLGEIFIPEFLSIEHDTSVFIIDPVGIMNRTVETYASRSLHKIPGISYKGGPKRSPDFIRSMIRDYLDRNKGLSPDLKETLETLIKELYAVEETVNFIIALVSEDAKIYAFLTNNKEIQTLLRSEKEEDKQKAIDILQKQFPLFTTSTFLQRLMKISYLLQ